MSRKSISPETTFEAVMELLARKEPCSVIASRYNMSEQSLRNAKEEFLTGAKTA